MMSCALNEIETLLAKAARGAGAAPAQAGAFGRAGLCHIAAGRPVSDLDKALAALPGGAIIDTAAQLQAALANAQDAQAHIDLTSTPLMRSWAESLPYAIENTSQNHATLRLSVPQRRPMPHRLSVASANLEHWKTLAQKLYVPETEHSRAAGAGAGLTDND